MFCIHVRKHVSKHCTIMSFLNKNIDNIYFERLRSQEEAKKYPDVTLDLSPCRYMLGLSCIPAVVQFIGFFFLPESPRWLLQKGRSQEARQVLSRIRGGRSVEREFDAIRSSIEEEDEEPGSNGGEGNDM